MIKLVIFDLGETLIFYNDFPLDWSSHYETALKTVCNNLSIGFDETKIKTASSILYKYNTRVNPRTTEVSSDQIFLEIFREANIDEVYLDSFIKEFFKYFQRKAEPEKTALELLTFLKQKNINIAVLTDVPYGMPKDLVMEDLKPLNSYIDFVLTSVEAGTRKPSTAGHQMLLDRFDCKNSEAVYVGNEKKDIDMAKNAGVFSVLIDSDGKTPDWGQNKTISKLSDLKISWDK